MPTSPVVPLTIRLPSRIQQSGIQVVKHFDRRVCIVNFLIIINENIIDWSGSRNFFIGHLRYDHPGVDDVRGS